MQLSHSSAQPPLVPSRHEPSRRQLQSQMRARPRQPKPPLSSRFPPARMIMRGSISRKPELIARGGPEHFLAPRKLRRGAYFIVLGSGVHGRPHGSLPEVAPARPPSAYQHWPDWVANGIGAVKPPYRTLARYGEQDRDPERLKPLPERRRGCGAPHLRAASSWQHHYRYQVLTPIPQNGTAKPMPGASGNWEQASPCPGRPICERATVSARTAYSYLVPKATRAGIQSSPKRGGEHAATSGDDPLRGGALQPAGGQRASRRADGGRLEPQAGGCVQGTA